MKAETYFLSVPLAVLRRFVEMNKDKPDNWSQLFELDPRRIFSKSEIEQMGNIESNGSIIVDLDKLYKGGGNAN